MTWAGLASLAEDDQHRGWRRAVRRDEMPGLDAGIDQDQLRHRPPDSPSVRFLTVTVQRGLRRPPVHVRPRTPAFKRNNIRVSSNPKVQDR